MKRFALKPAIVLALVLAANFIVISSLPLLAEEEDKTPVAIPKTESGIDLDGSLDDPAWKNAAVFEIAYETSPEENVEAPVKTTVYMMYDNSNIYVGFKAYDPRPEEIRARYRDRDNLWGDDSVSVTFDTFNDELRSYEFGANPLGVQSDSYRGGNSGGDSGGGGSSWDGIWETAGQTYDWGYSIEMAIPFNVLRFQHTKDDQIWGFFARRVYPRSVSRWMRNTPDIRGTNCELCEAQKIKGFADIAPGRNVEITPTLSAIRQDYKPGFPYGDMEELDTSSNVGLSGSWGITPNYTFSAAINPDFSQIEADQLRLTINERFALRFREKRPFFLEGNEFFSGIHTRMIADPVYGLKLTGREGANSFGFIQARDEVTNLILPGVQGSDSASYERENDATVLRYNRDTFNNSTVGLIMTNRAGKGEYNNRVYGIDSNIRLTSNDSFSVKVLSSTTKYDADTAQEFEQPEDEFSGRLVRLSYNKSTRDWHAMFSYEDVGEDLRTDLDHRSMVGYKSYSAFAQRQWYGSSDDLYTRFSFNGDFEKMEDQHGNLLNKTIRMGSSISGPLQSRLNYNLSKYERTYYDDVFNGYTHSIRTGFQPTADIGFEWNMNFGDSIDYYNSQPSQKINISPEIDINFGRHLKFSADYSFTRMTVEDDELYTTNTIESQLSYQFNTRMFLRSIIQFADVRRNQDMYEELIDTKYQSIFSQILFSYKVNPRTVLFVGYSDNYSSANTYDGIIYDLTQADRTIFFKVGYAWLM